MPIDCDGVIDGEIGARGIAAPSTCKTKWAGFCLYDRSRSIISLASHLVIGVSRV